MIEASKLLRVLVWNPNSRSWEWEDIDDRVYRKRGGGGGGGSGGGGPPAPIGYNFTQPVPAMVWNIPHGLGYYPVVQPRNAAGQLINDVDMIDVDIDNVRITWFVPTAGYARCV